MKKGERKELEERPIKEKKIRRNDLYNLISKKNKSGVVFTVSFFLFRLTFDAALSNTFKGEI